MKGVGRFLVAHEESDFGALQRAHPQLGAFRRVSLKEPPRLACTPQMPDQDLAVDKTPYRHQR